MADKTRHIVFLDYIRVIACFFVVLLHTSSLHYHNFSPAWDIYLVYDAISRNCVPLFLMLSGYLLLDCDISSLSRFYCKRYSRIVIPFAIICLLYYFTPEYKGYTINKYILHILDTYVDYHLWYIYVLGGIYLALPFMIKIIHGQDGIKLAIAYTSIWAIIHIIISPLLVYYGKKCESFEYVLFFSSYMGYVLAGWFVKLCKPYFNRNILFFNLAIFICATLAIIYGARWHSLSAGKPQELFFYNLSPFVFLQSISFFVFCAIFHRERPWIAELSDKAFWIYLVHLLYLRMFESMWPLPLNYNAIWAIPLMAAGVFGMSYLTALPLRKLENMLFALLRRFLPV